ncbi:hypothetical protein DL1_05635 [Thioclava dalianensis]|uniref:YjiS-like domain-containing protein n=1 Tax=Thioclava dalianensis TaxID=1185766 RepID=A0A074TJ80_9RHOB|nr:DUF1127 domain-containing protein [Thioclava dalianensis]KEP69073.1 hypothetical protein DL1_05635 [Thioclava dalianensis]SFM83874.1 Uncharacterized conserved protein YjiS, DUF1127 family [Thioclava dalianensis]
MTQALWLFLQPRRATLGLTRRLRLMRELRRSRRALSRLSRDGLEDIGLSAQEACREAERPYWDAPSYWRQ